MTITKAEREWTLKKRDMQTAIERAGIYSRVRVKKNRQKKVEAGKTESSHKLNLHEFRSRGNSFLLPHYQQLLPRIIVRRPVSSVGRKFYERVSVPKSISGKVT